MRRDREQTPALSGLPPCCRVDASQSEVLQACLRDLSDTARTCPAAHSFPATRAVPFVSLKRGACERGEGVRGGEAGRS